MSRFSLTLTTTAATADLGKRMINSKVDDAAVAQYKALKG
jgi:hypothetical protein